MTDRRMNAKRLRGAAALTEALSMIGCLERNDHDLAAIVVNFEVELHAFLVYGIIHLANEKHDEMTQEHKDTSF